MKYTVSTSPLESSSRNIFDRRTSRASHLMKLMDGWAVHHAIDVQTMSVDQTCSHAMYTPTVRGHEQTCPKIGPCAPAEWKSKHKVEKKCGVSAVANDIKEPTPTLRSRRSRRMGGWIDRLCRRGRKELFGFQNRSKRSTVREDPTRHAAEN